VTDKHKAAIFKEDDSLFTENVIMNEINGAVARNKEFLTRESNYDKIDQVVKSKQHTIAENVKRARLIWDKIEERKKKDIWLNLQILIKLSEKYATREFK